MTIAEYLKSLDPQYGSQEHQRLFLARMDRAQRLNPCRLDHSRDAPPTHRTSCYPKDAIGRMVGGEP